MEKKVASFKEYEIFMADKSCLNEIANFVVRENYSHGGLCARKYIQNWYTNK